ncbi:MAG: NADH-quinone oxidoreductase subunit B [Nitrospirae bacterium]|nr:NADH-quinone oxidoreductase subunit B [Nitrospirota bacterium]
MPEMDPYIERSPDGAVAIGTLDSLLNLARKNSEWYLLFATACCGIELMQTGGPRTDADRFGFVFRPTPRQADTIILAGTITYKMASRVRLLYEQMAEPRYVISMGSCANTGGPFYDSYPVVKGGDLILPVDVYVAGCPPRPEALIEALMLVQDKMAREPWLRKARGRWPDPKDPWPQPSAVLGSCAAAAKGPTPKG